MTGRVRASMVCACLLIAGPASAEEPSLATVLQRAAAYVAEFHRQLSSIVAEERYVQDWKEVRRGRWKGETDLQHRVLLSDLLLVKPGGTASWMEFRDVFEVDGELVRERNERLERLFLQPSRSTVMQISKVLEESARYNIGDVNRNVNTPIFPLQFLEAANQPRFRFKRTGDRAPTVQAAAAPDGGGAFRVSTEVWVIAYDERRSPTIIRNARRKDLPSRGRFWIEPATGRVLMSELRCEDRSVRAVIDVSFQSEPLLGLLVPVEMRERYDGKQSDSRVEGQATYGRFRQFQVEVNETLTAIIKR